MKERAKGLPSNLWSLSENPIYYSAVVLSDIFSVFPIACKVSIKLIPVYECL